jgi:hypothetical protein
MNSRPETGSVNINLMSTHSKLILKKLLYIFLILPIISGCGYSSRPMGEPLGIEIQSLSIPMIESPSSALGFEADFTSVVRREFISHSKAPLVSEKNAAMALIVKVVDIWTDPLSYNITKNDVQGSETVYETTNSRWIRIKVAAKLVDRSTGKTVWEDNNMRERTTYSLITDPPDPLANRYSEKKAVRRLAEDIAERLYLKTMETF